MVNIDQQQSTIITLMGAPNVGKSTLINALVGEKISIVTPKVQTTRDRIRGIVVRDNTQIVLVDTPGMFIPKRPLEKSIVQEARQALDESETIALIVDAKKGVCAETKRLIEVLEKTKKDVILVVNKIDKIHRDQLLPLTELLSQQYPFSKIFYISALKQDGVNDLLDYFVFLASPSPWLFPEDQMSDAPMRFLAAEITREQLFLQLQQELPYAVAVETEKWQENKKREIIIHQVIYTAKANQKPIILGKGGNQIKAIGEKSRKQLENLLGSKVHLFLHVKVKTDWQILKTGL